MQFDGTFTLVKDQRIVIVRVPEGIVEDPVKAGQVLAAYKKNVFRVTPAVLFGRPSAGGEACFFGPPDVVAELVKIDPRRLRWRRYRTQGGMPTRRTPRLTGSDHA